MAWAGAKDPLPTARVSCTAGGPSLPAFPPPSAQDDRENEPRRVLPEHLPLTSSPRPRERNSSTFFRGDTTPGDGQSVPHSTLSATSRPREVAQKRLRRDAGDIDVDVGMTAREEERGLAVERAAGVREDDLQPRKVDGHVVDRHRVGEHVAGPREDRRPGVEHHRHAALLALAIDLGQLPQLAAVCVRREELMRRMDLDQADAEVEDAADLAADVKLVERIHRACRDQAVAVTFVKSAIQSLTSRVKPITSGET